jgi:small subunit ribosomal protein S16
MGVRIRLARMGAKKKPFYRVVVADSKAPRDGRFIEQVGYYDPTKEPATFELDCEKIDQWMTHGAQPTQRVSQLIKKSKALSSSVSSEHVYRNDR